MILIQGTLQGQMQNRYDQTQQRNCTTNSRCDCIMIFIYGYNEYSVLKCAYKVPLLFPFVSFYQFFFLFKFRVRYRVDLLFPFPLFVFFVFFNKLECHKMLCHLLCMHLLSRCTDREKNTPLRHTATIPEYGYIQMLFRC